MNAEEYSQRAFARNLGLIDEQQQRKLGESRVAVAGAGGVGGLHLLTLARLGVGKFTIADFDVFELPNINRQFGALSSTIGREKAQIVADMVRDINPFAETRVFGEGITPENLDDFLSGVDVFVDGIDFFEIDIRRKVFQTCREKGIYSLTAAPLGFGATLQVFAPDGMSFDDYFGIRDDMEHTEKIAAFATGLAPQPFHIKYLDLKRVSFQNRTGPAVAPACTLAASFIATEVVKIITGRGDIRPVPSYLQFDMMRIKVKKGRVWLGGNNPLQRLKKWVIMRKVRATMEGKV